MQSSAKTESTRIASNIILPDDWVVFFSILVAILLFSIIIFIRIRSPTWPPESLSLSPSAVPALRGSGHFHLSVPNWNNVFIILWPKNLLNNKNIINFVVSKDKDIEMKIVNRKLSEKEWQLIEALRNFRKTKHNPSIELELFVDSLYENLKEADDD